jgi:hypothetical protein
MLVGSLLVVTVACGDATSEDVGSTPGFDGNGRTVDTRPFEAPTAEGDGSTTLPEALFEGGPLERTTTSTTTTTAPTTTTTLPIPPPPTDDPICGMATIVIEALRLATDPAAIPAESLPAAGARFAAAADLLAAEGRADLGPLEALLRSIARDLPGAPDAASAAEIYNQLLSPSDPDIVPVANEFGAHLQSACPALLTLEP